MVYPGSGIILIAPLSLGLSRSRSVNSGTGIPRQKDLKPPLRYGPLRSHGQTPEFAKMVTVPANHQAVSRFLSDESRPMVDYLPPSLIRLVAESRR